MTSAVVSGSATILFRKLFDNIEVTEAYLQEILSYTVDVDWVDNCLQHKRLRTAACCPRIQLTLGVCVEAGMIPR
jgi:hypothetical protein